MYLDFFQLKEIPFNITPNPDFLYLSPTHSDALRHIHYGIEERKGFIVLTGEVGCGKTTLCRRLLNEIDEKRFDTALVVNPRMSETELLREILHELGESTQAESKTDLIHKINQVLLERIRQGKDILLIIDEAQNLSFEVLEQVRLLSNLETNEQKLLQIILMGQPELKEKLRENRLRQLRQRVLVYAELKPLNRKQIENYITHRLTLAGANGFPRFTYWALRKIHKKSCGIPRIINNICDKAMLAAYVRNSQDTINLSDVKRALEEIENLHTL